MNKDVLIRLSDAIAYFNWPLGDKVTQSHVRSLREAADALEAADKRIEELESDLKATQENEYRLAEANKPLLARAFKADKRIAELESLIDELRQTAGFRQGLIIELREKLAALKEQVEGEQSCG